MFHCEVRRLGAPTLCPALCSLQIFTYERKWYSRKDLARHRMQGDPDDTSHRGHPLCKFCDERYLDNDELLKHLRRDHYFCHFCDSDGAQDYYRWAGLGCCRECLGDSLLGLFWELSGCTVDDLASADSVCQ